MINVTTTYSQAKILPNNEEDVDFHPNFFEEGTIKFPQIKGILSSSERLCPAAFRKKPPICIIVQNFIDSRVMKFAF